MFNITRTDVYYKYSIKDYRLEATKMTTIDRYWGYVVYNVLQSIK